ncbi:MAG: YcjF family protein [Planctomycetota bacterium]|nr:YcjF family protein [Planctomycetota bacterium]
MTDEQPSMNHLPPGEPDAMPAYIDVPGPEDRPATQRASAPTIAAARDEPGSAREDASLHRENECVGNTPDIEPTLADGNFTAMPEPSPPFMEDEDASPIRPGWFRRGYPAFALLLGALFPLFVLGQALSAIALASPLPGWAKYVFYPAMAVCGVVALGVCLAFVRSWFRLRAVRQVNLDALDRLRALAESRRLGLRRCREARERLTRYLADYPLDRQGAGGFDADAIRELRSAREHLVSLSGDSRAWLRAYADQFQRRLDEQAGKIVRAHALRAGVCAMASPVPLLDALLVLGVAVRMLSSLCRVYNLRLDATALPLLLVRVIKVAFLAGIGQEAIHFGIDRAGDVLRLLSEEESAELAAEAAGEGILGAAGASVARFAGAKLAEGAVNGLFMRRLGRTAIRLLKPVHMDGG